LAIHYFWINHAVMITALEICNSLGRRELAKRIGVTKTAVSNAAVDGKFPARWFVVVSAMCAEQGLECPQDAFSFVEDIAANPPSQKDAAA
jgi:DNA-binding Xre family transcriptional regulator